ncbi:DUF1631 family protein [Roseateles sp. BYS87W]|uniref:DUF1631 family protein n=1 Tax=Pelomonas baiyunensis TaxID=3299026 RepID=A0ABW7GYK0_9BURK
MQASQPFDRHVRFLEAQAQPFASHWVEAMLQAMRDPVDAGLGAVDRKALSGLLLTTEPLRMHIAECLSGHLLRGFEGAEARLLGRGAAASALSGFDIDELTLVDEAQAEKDIEISRVVQLADLQLEWELRELQGLASNLLTDPPRGEDPTACGPALFARAISQTVYEQVLEPEQQAVWMRVATQTLVAPLRQLLGTVSARLRDEGVQAPRYRTILAPNSSAVMAQAAASAPFAQPPGGVAPAWQGPAPTGAASHALAALPAEQLQALLQQIPLLQRGLAGAAGRAASAPPASSAAPSPLAPELRLQLEPLAGAPAPAPAPAPVADAGVSHALLARLFERLLADPQLASPARGAIAQLQAPVQALAAHDPGVLSSDQHPAWALINKIAGHSGALPAHDAERGAAFQRFVDPLVSQLSTSQPQQPEAYAAALEAVESFIDDEQQQQIERSRPAMDALGQREAERRLLPLMRDQVEAQLAKTPDVSPIVQTFLRGPWIEVLTKVMAAEGAESPESQALVGTVDELLASLERPETPAARADLRRRLPGLIGRVQQGMALIDLPQQHRTRVLAELMQTHRRHLAERSEAAPTPASVPAAAPQADAAGTTPSRPRPTEPLAPRAVPEPAAARPSARSEPAEAPASRPAAAPGWFDDDDEDDARDSRPASGWEARDTHIGALPTVPMGLDDPSREDAAGSWIDALRPGLRCKLHLQGVWATAQLAWVSDNGAFFMFTSNLAGGMHSMTRRALKRLRSEGLATELAETSPVQRALGGLLQELGGGAAG